MDAPLVTGLEELDRLAQKGRESLYPSRPKIVVGMSSCGLAAGAGEQYDILKQAITKREADITLARTGCIGYCQREPLVDVILPDRPRVMLAKLKNKDLDNLVEGIGKGEIATKRALAYIEQPAVQMLGGEATDGGPGFDGLSHIMELDFYSKQRRVALRNCGFLDPGNIEEYIARGGYRALLRVLKEMGPEDVIDEVTRAGLRGRGGAGFPTGRKWSICREQDGDQKYIICNGDEGDPGAFMDRSIMEGDPHSVIEGMIIGAHAIGSSKGYLYVRGEYPLAITNLSMAIDHARALGLLGKDIMGTDFSFDLRIVKGAGAFVCGEETALIASIEGDIGSPRQRPPFPAQAGLWGKPTNINNVESWANVSAIVEHGADWYASTGTDSSKGTKVFSLVGKVKNTGMVEVPMGTPLREIVYNIGGGIQKKREFKAVQTGGPSGGCIPASLLDLPVDFDKLRESGAMMGSGGLIVMDERTCMVDLAKYFLAFLVDESCGKCTPCREGVHQMYSIVGRIAEGNGQDSDIKLLEELATYVKDSSLCQLGGTAPNPVLSTIRYFRDEYEAHIRDKRCPAGVCKALIEFSIDSEACTGCELCRKNCPTEAISGEKKQPHTLDRIKCVKCGVCYDVCMFNAVNTDKADESA